MNTTSLVLTIILSFVQLIVPRRFLLLPCVLAACFVPMNQMIDILNLHFTLLRILLLVGFLRLTIRGEIRVIQWNNFDKLILSWAVIGSLIYIIQQADSRAIIYKSGVTFDILLMYWFFRQAIVNWDDVFQGVKLFAFFAIITAPLISLEKYQETSFFSLLGPIAAEFHHGRFRAAGPFPHFIIMGCFWALLIPFFYARIKARESGIFYWLAILAALSNVYFSASSTSIITFIAIIAFWMMYRYRMYGKFIFLGTCCGLFLLHVTMKAPIWHLLSRANIFGGSTGWHRFFTFDTFVNTTSEWFLFGSKNLEAWKWYDQIDITNQLVLEGVRGGMITLLIFIIIIYFAVKIPGNLSLCSVKSEVQWMCWGICVSMLAHFVTFWGVAYFGQINMLLIFTFALVGFALEKSSEAETPSPHLASIKSRMVLMSN